MRNEERQPITDIDIPKDMLQIISWITNATCQLGSSQAIDDGVL